MRATQVAKAKPVAICGMDMAAPAWIGGNLVDGFDKTDWLLPYHNLMHRGKPNLQHEAFLRSEGFGFPARGLGDTIAKIADATGLAAVASAWEKVSGRECGCAQRRERLNGLVPYEREGSDHARRKLETRMTNDESNPNDRNTNDETGTLPGRGFELRSFVFRI